MGEHAEKGGTAGSQKRVYEERQDRKNVRWKARTLVLGDDVWEKLAVESVRKGKDKSRLADAVLYEALRRYVISYRGGGSPQGTSASPADEASDSVPTLPIAEAVTSPGEDSAAEEPGKGRGSRRKVG